MKMQFLFAGVLSVGLFVRPGRRPLRFSRPGIIIRQLIFQIMLRAFGDRKQPCALSSAIGIIGFPRTGRSEI